jgi:predicted 2-oxoglutarate/Fe(II)-dependent dioxygenase YbiX
MVLNYTQYLKINITTAIVSDYMQKTNNIRIMRYKEGQEIKDHLDIGNLNHRASCTINLNLNYEGGEFSFFSSKHLLNLKEGEGIIFPAEQIWIHGVRPVTKGTRYAINCFLSPI